MLSMQLLAADTGNFLDVLFISYGSKECIQRTMLIISSTKNIDFRKDQTASYLGRTP